MRLGLFGGSFDPVHLGHLLLAESAREQARLDELWFIPAAQQPLKQHRSLTPGTTRVQMLQLAIGGHPAFRVSTVELDRGGVSFTVDTLAAIQAQRPDADLCFLMGADSLAEFDRWREPQRICELATLLVACRAGEPLPDISGVTQRLQLPSSVEMRVERIDMPGIELSSRDIRRRVSEGRSIRFRVPRAVEMVIETAGLYRAGTA